jgi:hypothetical protein
MQKLSKLKTKKREKIRSFILDREIDFLYQESVENGKAEAVKKTKIEIPKTMLVQKLPLEMIVSITGWKKRWLKNSN